MARRTGSTTNSSYHEYIFFAGRRIAQSNRSTGSVYYYFADHLGSTRVVTTATGSPCYEADFLPYGTENTPYGFSNTCSTNYKFTGYEREAETAYGTSSGNDYAFARYYNARLGRFMSGDPLDGDISDPQTLNKYAYVRNNPLNFTDPSGQGPCGDEPNNPCPVPFPQPDPWAGNWSIVPLPPVPIGCSMMSDGAGCSPIFNVSSHPVPPYTVKPGPGQPQKCPGPVAQTVNAALIASNLQLAQATLGAYALARLTGDTVISGAGANGAFGVW